MNRNRPGSRRGSLQATRIVSLRAVVYPSALRRACMAQGLLNIQNSVSHDLQCAHGHMGHIWVRCLQCCVADSSPLPWAFLLALEFGRRLEKIHVTRHEFECIVQNLRSAYSPASPRFFLYTRFTCHLHLPVGYIGATHFLYYHLSPTIPLRPSFLIHMKLLDINERDYDHVQHMPHIRVNIKISILSRPQDAKCGSVLTCYFHPCLVVLGQLCRANKRSKTTLQRRGL